MKMKIYENYRDRFSRANAFKLPEYKKLLKREDEYIIDLLFEIEAYHAGFTMQIWHDFRKINLELKINQTLIDFIKDEGNYDENDVIDMVKKVDSYFKSSFENANSEKLKELMLERELMFIKPRNEDAVTLEEDYQENWIKIYENSRNKIALDISEKYQIKGKVGLFIKIFNQVTMLANNSSLLENTYTKSLIRLLEQGVETYLPMFYRDLRKNALKASLDNYRKNETQEYNTQCWRCGKPLFKKNGNHYCTRFENRSCYIERFNDMRNPGMPSVIQRTKNLCDRCKTWSSLNFIHKLGRIEMQFCSKKCWETFRKAQARNKNIASFTNKLSQKTVVI